MYSDATSKTGTWRGVLRTTEKISIFVLLLLAVSVGPDAGAQDWPEGRIIGKVVDGTTGEPIIGASVLIQNTSIGAATDLDGAFIIRNSPVGAHTLVISSIGYMKLMVKDVLVTPDAVTEIDFAMVGEAIEGKTVVVQARKLVNTDAALLKHRQSSNAVSDAISGESISRAGAGDAADAVKQVTGASVVGGKYVYIRGLGERYSSTHLNGVELPSADPDRRSFNLDLLPSSVLDNIVTVKSFTPDKPGNFSGGIVDLGTRSFPKSLDVRLSTSSSYNSQATFNDDFTYYSGSGTDWLGFDDGLRDLPDILGDGSVDVPDIGSAVNDPDRAQQLDDISRSFNSTMAPSRRRAPGNYGYSLSIGNQTEFLERTLGYLASFSYNRKYSFYDGGAVGRWRLTGHVDQVQELNRDFLLQDALGEDEVLWGGLATFTYKLHANHELGAHIVATQSGTSSARYLNGKYSDGNLPENATFETRVLKYTERALRSFQLRGRHNLDNMWNSKLEWNGSYSLTSQDEPDLRFFSDHYTVSSLGASADTVYNISPSVYRLPSRYYRNLDETNAAGNLDITIPFKTWSGRQASVKFGGAANTTTREYRERRYDYQNYGNVSYDGDADEFFSPDNVGIIDSDGETYTFGNFIVDASELRSNYDGDQDITAGYFMVDLALSQRLRLTTGTRLEMTRMSVNTQDANYLMGKLEEDDLLPSASLVYQLHDNMNLRAAYGRTLARPTLRELAPFPSYEFAGGFFFVGNPELERTLIDNFDLRWEWFANAGEIIAVSGFYKNLDNPIERVIKNDNGEVQYQNVDQATVYGMEFEVRKTLGGLIPILRNFHIGGNLSLVHSQVDIAPDELLRIRAVDPGAESTRELQGQSPVIVNLDLAYDNRRTGTSSGIYYNVFGERLSEVSLGGTPNIYEQPRHILNFTLSQRIWGHLQAKLAGKNLIDSSIEKVHHYKGQEYIHQEYKHGRTISLGLSYNIS